MICPDCARLRTELELTSFEAAAHRRELERLRKFAEPAILFDVLCLKSLVHAKMLLRLYRTDPEEWVKAYDLEDDQPVDYPDINTVRVYIGRLRHALGDGIIETQRNEGYRLTASGRDLVKHVLGGGHPADMPVT